MWIIVVNNNLNQRRDNLINELLQEKVDTEEFYLCKVGGKYNTTRSIFNAVTFKKKSYCEKFVKEFNESKVQKISFQYDKFYWVKDKYIGFREITFEEQLKNIDTERYLLEKEYRERKNKIEEKLIKLKIKNKN